MRNIHPLTMKHVKKNLQAAADSLCAQADYYANTPEGQADVQAAVSEAGRAATQAGRLAWAVACGVARSVTRKAQDCCQAQERPSRRWSCAAPALWGERQEQPLALPSTAP